MKRWWLPLLPALALVGCTRKPPVVSHDPGLTMPAAWTADTSRSGEVGEAWWQDFGDPGLAAAVARALQNNRDLKAAAARVEIAVLEAEIAGAGGLPQMAGTFSGNRRRQNFIGFPIPGGERRVLSSTFTTLGASLNVSWEADLWGRIGAGEVAALAATDAETAVLAASRLSLAGQVSKAWFSLAEINRQIALAERTIESYRGSANWIRLRYESGLRPSIDLRLALANVASAEALLAQRREQRQRLLRSLEVLLGAYPSGTLSPPSQLPSLPPDPPAGLPADLLSRRPDLVAAERRLTAADASIVQSRAALYPSLSLSGSGGSSSRALADLLDGDFGVWSLVAGLAQPIFQGGRLRNQIEISRLRAREALEQWAGAVLRALSEVESALAAERDLTEQLARVTGSVTQARAALGLAEERYRRGVGDVLTVLESQRRLLDGETQLLTLRRLQLDNRVDLHLALGGGFPPPQLRLSPDPLSSSSTGEVQP